MPGVTTNTNMATEPVSKLSKTSEKAVQAEMKNKRETARLQTHNRAIDKQISYTRFESEKAKLTAYQFLRRMRETSGRSSEGQPLDGPGDRDYAKTHFARQTMSDNRMRQWRLTEEKVQKYVGSTKVEQQKIAHVEETEEQAAEKLKIVLGMMGYDDDDILRILNHIEYNGLRSSEERQSVRKVNNKCRRLSDMKFKHVKRQADVFERLRQVPEPQPPPRQINSSIRSESSTFSVKDWEESMLKSYTDLAASRPAKSKRPLRVRSAQEISREFGNRGTNSPALRPKSAVSKRLTRSKSSDSNQPIKTVAFQVDDFENDNKNDPVISGQLDDITDIEDSSDDSLNMVSNGPLSIRPHSSICKRQSPVATKPPRPKTTGETSRRSVSVPVTSTPRQASTESIDDENTSQIGVNTDEVQEKLETNIHHQAKVSNSSSSLGRQRSILKSNSASSFKSTTSSHSATSDNNDVFDIELPATTINNAKRGSFAKNIRFSNSTARKHRASISVPTRQLSHKHGSRRKSFKTSTSSNSQDENEAMLPRRASMPVTSRKQRHGSDNSAHEREYVYDDSMGGLLPRWKRDLLREAPGSLQYESSHSQSGGGGSYLSKARRLRELQRMKDENLHDVKKICDDEHLRRRQSRINVFMTMMRVQEAVEGLRAQDEARSRTSTRSSFSSVEA